MGQRIITILKIAFAGYSLKSKIKLSLAIQDFLEYVNRDIETVAIDKGQLHTLQAMRAVVDERMNK